MRAQENPLVPRDSIGWNYCLELNKVSKDRTEGGHDSL